MLHFGLDLKTGNWIWDDIYKTCMVSTQWLWNGEGWSYLSFILCSFSGTWNFFPLEKRSILWWLCIVSWIFSYGFLFVGFCGLKKVLYQALDPVMNWSLIAQSSSLQPDRYTDWEVYFEYFWLHILCTVKILFWMSEVQCIGDALHSLMDFLDPWKISFYTQMIGAGIVQLV
jgi:hypothetical protein